MGFKRYVPVDKAGFKNHNCAMSRECKIPYRQGIEGAELTLKQRAFVTHLVRQGCKPAVAAKYAGYQSPRTAAYDLLKMPHLQAAISFETLRYVHCELVGLATATLRSVMSDQNAPASARIAASRTVLEVSRDLEHGKTDVVFDDRSLEEIDPGDLTQMLTQWEHERSSLLP
jgi:hypothetical protein